jgi:shikimate kinase
LRLYLCGFMGAGKSKVGRLVAQMLNYAFVDLDSEVERRALSPVAEIFATAGEARFRELEREELRATATRSDVIVALGGGSFASPENRALIGELGVSLWLDVPFANILGRLDERRRARRPLFSDIEKARQLVTERAPIYALADLRLAVEVEAPAPEVAARIISLLRDRQLEIPRSV